MIWKALQKLQTYLRGIEAIFSSNSFKIGMHDQVITSNAVRDSVASKNIFVD